MSGHTPGELTYQGNEIWANGKIIAFMPLDGLRLSKMQNQANARRIVTAVNAHDKLVAACKAALEAIGNLQHDCWSMPDGVSDLLRDSIALAEGTP